MVIRNKFIAIEGIDGAGKRTQMELLSRALTGRRIAHTLISFPRYDSFMGKMVARFLNGEFGPLEQVDPHFSALLYAGDRLEARDELVKILQSGRGIIADRYVGSNLAHHGARVAPARRQEFLGWLRHLEYNLYQLPEEGLVVYLRVPAEEAQRLVEKKGARAYTARKRDLAEADLPHLQEAAKVYDQLAESEPAFWATVECFDAAAGKLFPPETIHRAVMKKIGGCARYIPWEELDDGRDQSPLC